MPHPAALPRATPSFPAAIKFFSFGTRIIINFFQIKFFSTPKNELRKILPGSTGSQQRVERTKDNRFLTVYSQRGQQGLDFGFSKTHEGQRGLDCVVSECTKNNGFMTVYSVNAQRIAVLSTSWLLHLRVRGSNQRCAHLCSRLPSPGGPFHLLVRYLPTPAPASCPIPVHVDAAARAPLLPHISLIPRQVAYGLPYPELR